MVVIDVYDVCSLLPMTVLTRFAVTGVRTRAPRALFTRTPVPVQTDGDGSGVRVICDHVAHTHARPPFTPARYGR